MSTTKLLHHWRDRIQDAGQQTIDWLAHSDGAHQAPTHALRGAWPLHLASSCSPPDAEPTKVNYRNLLAITCGCAASRTPTPDGHIHPDPDVQLQQLAAASQLWSVAEMCTANLHQTLQHTIHQLGAGGHWAALVAIFDRDLTSLLTQTPTLQPYTQPLHQALRQARHQLGAATFDNDRWARKALYRYIPRWHHRLLARLTTSWPYHWHPNQLELVLAQIPPELGQITTPLGTSYLTRRLRTQLSFEVLTRHAADTVRHNQLLFALVPAPAVAQAARTAGSHLAVLGPDELTQPDQLLADTPHGLRFNSQIADAVVKTHTTPATAGGLAAADHINAVCTALH